MPAFLSPLYRSKPRSVAPDRRKAVIRHEEIPGYMPAMTMELTVRNPNELKEIKPGDAVSFRLLANEKTHWIDNIRRLENVKSVEIPDEPPVVKATNELKTGDLVPDFEMIGETAERIRVSQFRGKALAFTFIFTRCPLPDYCPLMGRNLEDARKLLLKTPGASTNWQFLSISFDPEFDTPETLTHYAKHYRGSDSNQWLFAAAPEVALREIAPRLDLTVNRKGGSISHNLRTIVLDTHGRIHRQFDGNLWKAEELAEAVREAAKIP